jgi:AcrR family transcriptional regulator
MVTRMPAVERRRQLLDVALEVFAARGFYGTSMDELAETAGVTKPVFYKHFGSKRSLYLELLEDTGARLIDEITKVTAEADGPRQQVEAGFAAYFRFVAENEHAFRLLFGAAPRRGGSVDQDLTEASLRVEDAIAEAIAPLIDAPIDDDHRRLLAQGIVGVAEATGRFWLAEGRKFDAETLGRRIADLAWAGLRGVHT